MIPFETSRGAPSNKRFVHIERVSDPGQPVTLPIWLKPQDIQSVSTHDEYQLAEITRRNSIRSDVRDNRERVGGVLLNLDGVCYWPKRSRPSPHPRTGKDFDVFDGWDTFKGDFVVRELSIEENDERGGSIVHGRARRGE